MTKHASRIRAIGAILAAGCLSACASDGTLKPGEERVVDGEEQTIADIGNLLATQLARQYGDEPFLRDTHPKSNGCVKAEFRVDDDIPAEFKNGVFKQPASYKAWLRFSNSAPQLTHDIEKDFRGLAIKLFDVEGKRLPVPGDEQQTQDFLFIAFPAFFAGNPSDFLAFFEANFNGDRLDRSGYILKRPRAALNTLQGWQRFGNPLEITWYSVAPFLIGRQQADGSGLAVKYKVESCTPRNVSPPEIADTDEDYLRHAMELRLAEGDHCLEFSLQKQSDPSDMPIEDTLASWDEEQSPFIRVAQLIVPKQTFGSPAQLEFCENLSFNPWNGLKEHQPLGGINPARWDVMKNISDLRLKQRGVERTEFTCEESFY